MSRIRQLAEFDFYNKSQTDSNIVSLSPPTDLTPYYNITQVDAQISSGIGGVIDGAPATLDTLREIALSIGNDNDLVGSMTTLLDGKVDDSQVLTNVPSGALFTDTVYTHPTNHAISVVTGLQSALDGKVDDSQVLTNVPSGALFTDTETTTTLSVAANVLKYTDEVGGITNLDLSLYLDDTNLAYVQAGTLNGTTGIATFTRSDATTFTVDLSALLDDTSVTVNNTLTSISTTEALSANQGKVLKGLADGLETRVALNDAKVSNVDHPLVQTAVPVGALFTDNNTTYSVGDGGLTQKNFTSADHSKLNGIEAGATADQTGAQIKTLLENGIDSIHYVDGSIDAIHIASGTITATQLAANCVDSSELVNGSIDNGHLATDCVNGAKIANDSINSEHYVDGSIDRAHLAADIIDGTKIANDVINSEHYVAGSIDNEHIADNAINSEHYADNSIDALHLNVSGNGTTSQYLRSDGDGTMSWVTPPDTNTDTNTTYSADGNYGMTLSGTAFRLEDDRRRNSTTTDIYSGNTHDYTFYDASHGIRWYTAGSEEMRLENDGDLHVDGDVIAYSTTVSDERLKTGIAPITDALSKVNQLKGCTFTYKADGRKSAGLIAQDVEKVLPSAVSEKVLPFSAEDEELYKTVQYDQTIGLLVEAIKELTAKVEELENK